jgi:hypothetical protein
LQRLVLADLYGPLGGETEEFGTESPTDRYLVGRLAPDGVRRPRLSVVPTIVHPASVPAGFGGRFRLQSNCVKRSSWNAAASIAAPPYFRGRCLAGQQSRRGIVPVHALDGLAWGLTAVGFAAASVALLREPNCGS